MLQHFESGQNLVVIRARIYEIKNVYIHISGKCSKWFCCGFKQLLKGRWESMAEDLNKIEIRDISKYVKT